MQIGRRLYYEKETGNIILNTQERQGLVVPTTPEQDIEAYVILSERNRDTFDFIELEYGEYGQDFLESTSCRFNPETKELEFAYPEPNEPDAPIVYQQPLSEQILLLKARSEANANRADFQEELIVELAMMIYT